MLYSIVFPLMEFGNPFPAYLWSVVEWVLCVVLCYNSGSPKSPLCNRTTIAKFSCSNSCNLSKDSKETSIIMIYYDLNMIWFARAPQKWRFSSDLKHTILQKHTKPLYHPPNVSKIGSRIRSRCLGSFVAALARRPTCPLRWRKALAIALASWSAVDDLWCVLEELCCTVEVYRWYKELKP